MEMKTPWQRLMELLSPPGGDPSDAYLRWAVAGGVALVLLLIVLVLVRALWRTLFGGRREAKRDWDRELRLDLADCPLPTRGWGERFVTVYHLPAQLRLVVVAPAGTGVEVDATAVEQLLDRIVPGLGAVAAHDRPRIRVWPAQLSSAGFGTVFHRCTLRPEPEGEPSRWVLLAGRAQVGRQPLLVVLGLWTE